MEERVAYSNPSERHSVPFESYNKRKRKLEEKYGKLIVLKGFNNEGIKNNINENYIRKIADRMFNISIQTKGRITSTL